MLREYGLDNIYVTTQNDTVYALLSDRALADPDDLIAQWKDERTRQWNDVYAGEMLAQVRSVAKGLMALGAKPGSTVVIYSATCYEWGVLDFACAAIGAVSVPIYETDSMKQASSIVHEVHPSIAFGGDEAHTQTLEAIAEVEDVLTHVFNLSNGALEALINLGEGVSDDALDEAIARVRADDLLTIVYTSGSTGAPKGAMLSNRNFTHIVKNGYEVLPEMLYEPSRLLLFLPLAHCFARYIQYTAIGGHGVVGYVPGAKHLLADLRGFKPTYLLGVPRVFEKVFNAASQKAGAGLRGRIFANAVRHFEDWSKMESEHKHPSLAMRMKHSFYMSTVATLSTNAEIRPENRLSATMAHWTFGVIFSSPSAMRRGILLSMNSSTMAMVPVSIMSTFQLTACGAALSGTIPRTRNSAAALSAMIHRFSEKTSSSTYMITKSARARII